MDNSPRHFRLVPELDCTNLRLDLYIAGKTGISRGELKKIIDIGGVHVGGRRMRRCSQGVKVGELIEVFLDGLPLEPFRLEQERILFRDRFLLAFDKPAGIDSQPTPARYKGTVYEALLEYLRDPFRPLDRPSVGMVQRLDRDTSGVMIFSIHPRAHCGLTAAFSGRDIRKKYLALVTGFLSDSGEMRSLLARSRSSNLMKSVPRGGKEAITRYRILEWFEGSCLVEIDIPTGRSHQIRVHFAEAGHPLLGDSRYGGPVTWEGNALPRTMLHAWRLNLKHPVTGEEIDLTAPLPQDMAEISTVLRGKTRG
jgi:23S rRNA pseudouridine1911/1915/1917 synthase